MTQVVHIPQHEQGTTRVFALSLSDTDAGALRDAPVRQADLLGGTPSNASGVEVFALSDLGDLGLAGYLRDGVDAHQDDLNRDRVKLAALDGWVMLVHSSAFGPDGATLTPDPALTLIGTYAQTPSGKPPVELQAKGAQPYSGTPTTPPDAGNPRARGSSWVVAALVILIVGIALLAIT